MYISNSVNWDCNLATAIVKFKLPSANYGVDVSQGVPKGTWLGSISSWQVNRYIKYYKKIIILIFFYLGYQDTQRKNNLCCLEWIDYALLYLGVIFWLILMNTVLVDVWTDLGTGQAEVRRRSGQRESDYWGGRLVIKGTVSWTVYLLFFHQIIFQSPASPV